MTNYWVDLSVNGVSQAPTHAGTQVDPFPFLEFDWFIDQLPQDVTFYLRGINQIATVGNSFVGKNITFDAWDLNLYGPWRLQDASHNSGIQLNDIITKNGIINDASMEIKSTINCYIIATDSSFAVKNNCSNSTIISTNRIKDRSTGSGLTITNILDNCGFLQAAGTLHIFNSGKTSKINSTDFFTDFGTPPTINNYSYGWIPPTLPSFNETDLSKFNLSKGFGVGSTGNWADVIIPPPPVKNTFKISFYKK